VTKVILKKVVPPNFWTLVTFKKSTKPHKLITKMSWPNNNKRRWEYVSPLAIERQEAAKRLATLRENYRLSLIEEKRQRAIINLVKKTQASKIQRAVRVMLDKQRTLAYYKQKYIEATFGAGGQKKGTGPIYTGNLYKRETDMNYWHHKKYASANMNYKMHGLLTQEQIKRLTYEKGYDMPTNPNLNLISPFDLYNV